MDNLPKGRCALCIAHPGHEIRLHGFIEKTKPFIFVLADQGDPSRMNRLSNYLGFIYKNTKKDKRDAFYVIEHAPDKVNPDPAKALSNFINDNQILSELNAGRTDFFVYYVKKTANRFVQNKIEFVVVDAVEQMDATHEINHAMIEAAIALVKRKTGKDIALYEFNVLKPFDHNITPECIKINLDEETELSKASFTLTYSTDIFTELRPNFTIDIETVNKMADQENGHEEIKNMLLMLNPSYFKHEYLKPAPVHEYTDEYKKLILPIREKLMKI